MLWAVFRTLSHERLESAVIGCFRFLPKLESAIRLRRPGGRLLLDEFVPCADGKRRYFRPLRTEVYETLIGLIRRLGGSVKVSVCMETPAVMRRLGASP
jgi:hypothetical protein